MRKGAKKASAAVDLVLHDGRILTLTREMPAKLTKSASVPAQASIQGALIGPDDAERLLADSLVGELSFLARLTMLRTLSSGLADPGSLDLTRNLSRIFGIDGLESALSIFEQRKKALAAEIRTTREVAPPSAGELVALQTAAADGTADVERANAVHENTIRAEREAEAALTGIDTYNNWVSAQNNRLRQVQALAAQKNIHADILSSLMTAHEANEEDLAASLNSLWQAEATRLTVALEETRVRAGVLRARIDTLRTALSELDSAQGQCPVCRRPLDADDEQAARTQHERELSGLETELAAVEDNSYQAELAGTQANLRNLLPLMHRGDAPPQPAKDHDTAQQTLDEARTARAGALDALVAARQSADGARDALQRASADQAADQHLIGLYKQEAAVLAAAAATQQAVNILMAQTVSPLADELAARWKLLFADRGDVRLESGVLSREINGQSLSYDAFSEGEKAFSQVLLRLLVLDAATRADFCWIDEPLDHLDPRTRRHVASMLARAVSTSNARQIVVTTYEEPLARRLALRHPDHVRVIYVRPEHPTAS